MVFHVYMYVLLINAGIVPKVENVQTTETYCDRGPCGAGQFYNVIKKTCEPCEEGTFMVQDDHQCRDCKPCMKAAAELEEILVTPCTATSDTVLGCTAGHYRTYVDNWPEPVCQKCSECDGGQVVVKPCEMDNDTVCGSRNFVAGGPPVVTTSSANVLAHNIERSSANDGDKGKLEEWSGQSSVTPTFVNVAVLVTMLFILYQLV